MLVFCFSVPKVRKSANNETKMFLSHFGYAFVFTNKKIDPLMSKFWEMRFAKTAFSNGIEGVSFQKVI